MPKISYRKRDSLFKLGLNICTRCNREKSLGEFAKASNTRNGYAHRCKCCNNEESRQKRINLGLRKKHNEKLQLIIKSRIAHEVEHGKLCEDCGATKTLSEFYEANTSHYPYWPKCKTCQSISAKKARDIRGKKPRTDTVREKERTYKRSHYARTLELKKLPNNRARLELYNKERYAREAKSFQRVMYNLFLELFEPELMEQKRKLYREARAKALSDNYVATLLRHEFKVRGIDIPTSEFPGYLIEGRRQIVKANRIVKSTVPIRTQSEKLAINRAYHKTHRTEILMRHQRKRLENERKTC